MKINELSSGEWNLISAYADGELSGNQRKRAEEIIARNKYARETLEAIRETKYILSALVVRKAPKNFILTRSPDKRVGIPSIFQVVRLSTVASAIMLLVVLFSAIFPLSQSNRAAPEMRAMETELILAESAALEDSEAPDIIFWGGSAAGLGSGKGAVGEFGIGGGGGQLDYPQAIGEQFPQAALGETESMPAEESAPLERLADETTTEKKSPIEESASENLILGIPPADSRGKILLKESPEKLREIKTDQFISKSTLALFLSGLTLVLGLSSWLLRKHL